jgi:hypothetical protein
MQNTQLNYVGEEYSTSTKLSNFPNAPSVNRTGINFGMVYTDFIRSFMFVKNCIQQYNRDAKLNKTARTLTRAPVLLTSSGY